MPRVTASSLERSLQNCSLSCSTSSSGLCETTNNNNNEVPSSSSWDDNSTVVQLNSHISLPYHWEQYLDLKTGELYYINWSTGKKAKEDPRTTRTGYNGDYYSSSAEDDDKDSSSQEEEEEEEESSQEESSSCSSTMHEHLNFNFRRTKYQQQQKQQEGINKEEVLVVAGCKGCFMYYMVPKHVDECPKCAAQLLHFPSNSDN